MWRLIARDRDGREVGRAEFAAAGDSCVIGRDPQSGIQLLSVGVSRRHAVVTLSGGRLTVSDEESANGVVVDGQRVQGTTALREGALLQIAEFLIEVETALELSRPPAGGSRGGRSSTSYVGSAAWRRWLVLAGIGALVLVLGGLVLARSCGRALDPKATRSALDRLAGEVEDHVERARVLIARRRWAEANDELGEVLTRDPLNAVAETLRVRVARERANSAILARAQTAAGRPGVDDELEARELYRGIPEDSVYRAEADLRRAELERKLPALLEREADRECEARGHADRCRRLVCAEVALGGDPATRARRRHPAVGCP
jgi:hypothetical protein